MQGAMICRKKGGIAAFSRLYKDMELWITCHVKAAHMYGGSPQDGGICMNQNSLKNRAEQYAELVKSMAPKSDIKKGLLRAFWVGGLICVIGQGIKDVFTCILGWGMDSASSAASILLILLSALLTGIGLYDRIGKYAGAGSIVPITGFANAVVSPAMEFRRDERVIIGPSRKTI